MAMFRKRPVVVEAIQWNGDLTAAVAFVTCEFSANHESLFIPTLEGEMTAQLGDWIIKGVAGEFYPCKPNIFYATYEPAQLPDL